MAADSPLKKAGRERVRQKLYRKRNDSSFLFFFGGGGGGFKIRISLFGGFRTAEFRHETEKVSPMFNDNNNTIENDYKGWRRRRNHHLCRRLWPFDGVSLLVGCLTSQQQASVSQGRICSDNFTCCHTEIQVADPTFYLTQSQYTDTGPTSPSADPITPGAWQGSQWSANFEVTGMTRPRKNPGASGIRTRDLPLSRRLTEVGSTEALYLGTHRLLGLVVKASASTAEDPGFESRWRRDFSGSSHTSDLNIGTPMATLPGAWCYKVSAGTGWDIL